MRTKKQHIPVNAFPAEFGEGIVIGRNSFDGVPDFEAVKRSHRDNGYSFILQEAGVTHIEIDFQQYEIVAPAVVFMHPQQVHRVIKFEKAQVTTWMMTNEYIRPELLQLMDELTPVAPVSLDMKTLGLLAAASTLCIDIVERENEKLYQQIVKESCNTLVALVVSQYLALTQPPQQLNRFEGITRSFMSLLAQHYITEKSPAAYARMLTISTPYLNECVKATTGFPVSHHIQQRVVLEAKRLLYHSGQSVKEMAGALGYEDHSYFVRLFVKVVGMTPLAFRGKNHE